MKVVRTLSALRREMDAQRAMGKSIGLVPTMGALHAGHMALLQRCQDETTCSVLSIFVNPIQFNQQADFDHYPRDEASDLGLAKSHGADVVWLPDTSEMQLEGASMQIEEGDLSMRMEGSSRPGHFSGVLTIVMKLLQQVGPERIYFGEKDYQQYQLIKEMVRRFCVSVDVVGCATVREPSGLAFSSRNQRLSVDEKRLAPALYRCLKAYALPEQVTQSLNHLGFKVDYVEDFNGRRYAAARLGDVRLIDNISLDDLKEVVC
jgi:pantoate--beta-alanine ligase